MTRQPNGLITYAIGRGQRNAARDAEAQRQWNFQAGIGPGVGPIGPALGMSPYTYGMPTPWAQPLALQPHFPANNPGNPNAGTIGPALGLSPYTYGQPTPWAEPLALQPHFPANNPHRAVIDVLHARGVGPRTTRPRHGIRGQRASVARRPNPDIPPDRADVCADSATHWEFCKHCIELEGEITRGGGCFFADNGQYVPPPMTAPMGLTARPRPTGAAPQVPLPPGGRPIPGTPVPGRPMPAPRDPSAIPIPEPPPIPSTAPTWRSSRGRHAGSAVSLRSTNPAPNPPTAIDFRGPQPGAAWVPSAGYGTGQYGSQYAPNHGPMPGLPQNAPWVPPNMLVGPYQTISVGASHDEFEGEDPVSVGNRQRRIARNLWGSIASCSGSNKTCGKSLDFTDPTTMAQQTMGGAPPQPPQSPQPPQQPNNYRLHPDYLRQRTTLGQPYQNPRWHTGGM